MKTGLTSAHPSPLFSPFFSTSLMTFIQKKTPRLLFTAPQAQEEPGRLSLLTACAKSF
jgi:hypothetical protein